MSVAREAREVPVAEPERAAQVDQAPSAPTALTPQVVTALQRTAGNVAVQRLLARAPVLARDLNSDYEGAVKTPDWQLAAEALSKFKRDEIVAKLAKLTVAQLTSLHQGAVDKLGATSLVAQLTPALLTSFAGSFRDAAELIRRSPEAMKVIAAAEAAGVKFGGYAENGPGKSAWAYTLGDTVYVPKARTDKVQAMSDFIFELNNASHTAAFDQIFKDADAGKINAKQYARRIVTQEVESLLSTGGVWAEIKQIMGAGKELDKYDVENYQAEYKAFKAGKKTKDDIINDSLTRVYPAGKNAGKTVEQNYMEQYAKRKAKPDAGTP